MDRRLPRQNFPLNLPTNRRLCSTVGGRIVEGWAAHCSAVSAARSSISAMICPRWSASGQPTTNQILLLITAISWHLCEHVLFPILCRVTGSCPTSSALEEMPRRQFRYAGLDYSDCDAGTPCAARSCCHAPCSVVRTRNRAGAGYACSARPDLHTVCRLFPKICDGARRGPWACMGGGGPTRHVCSICSAVRTRDRVAGAGFACSARPESPYHHLPLIY